MKIKHTIQCDGSEVLVHETDTGVYQVSIRAHNNPLGQGNALQTFSNMDEAVASAERFCQLHAIAKANGYHLEQDHFVRPDKPGHHVGQLLAEGKSAEELEQLLTAP
ncbi:hypothetical protein [Paenibacillus xerothermodurans]|uniref:Uncharacterized protein n=1 Tax=Paenibacillus xerothermodurans TaxID=1977292 RepID=A0A2W1NLE8_PAEXE|nr:hypothetical protein [Paenibacillus xerothermodurans]PZE20245.1 hypothetical protein CBW46_013925 [Paenibacillus xerothermodurans]